MNPSPRIAQCVTPPRPTAIRACLPALLLASLAACSSGEGSSKLSREQSAIKSFNDSYYAYLKAADEMGKATADVERIATSDGLRAVDGLTPLDVSDSLLAEHTAALGKLELSSRRALAKGYALLESAHAYGTTQREIEAEAAGEGALVQKDFGITALTLLAVGVVSSTYYSCKKVKQIAADHCEGVRNILSTTLNQQCLDAHAKTLRFPSGSAVTRDALVAYLDADPAMLNKCTDLKEQMRFTQEEMETIGVHCAAPTPQEIRDDVVKASKSTLVLAKDMGTGAYETVLGTTFSRGVQILTGSEDLGNLADLVLSLTKSVAEDSGGTLPTDEPVSVAVVSKATTPVVVSAPLPGPSAVVGSEQASQAIETLDSDKASPAQIETAADTILQAVANTPGSGVAPSSNSDGTMTVDVPASIFLGEWQIDGLMSELPLRIPNLGFSTTMVLTPQRVPEIELDVDTSSGATLGFPAQAIADFGEPEQSGDPGQSVSPSSGLSVNVASETTGAGQDIELVVHCPATVVFPATLDAPVSSGVSMAWGSPIDTCPITVLFNANDPGSYPLNFTLTDASGVVLTGSTTVVVGEASITEGVWTDPSTGLTWEAERVTRARTWDYAASYCENLEFGGQSDWRMPTIDELKTLLEGCPSAQACGITDACVDWTTCGANCSPCESNVGPGPDQSYSVPEVHPAVVLGAAAHFQGQGYSVESYELYWSSSGQVGGSMLSLEFRTATFRAIDTSDPIYQLNVRCVR